MRMTHVDGSISRTPIASEARDLATVCVLCSHNCGLRVDVADNAIVAVRGDASSPITGGYVCNKAFSVPAYVGHGQRVEHPLRRREDGAFERIGWDRAITEIAERLGAIRERHGGRAIGLVGIGGQANHLDAPYGLSWLRGVGSRRWFNAFAQEKTQHNLLDQWMVSASPAAFLHPDQHHTDYMLVLGTNPKVTNRGHNATDVFKAMARDPDKTVVVVDPRTTETTRGADRHLQVAPGGDCYLLLALAAVLVSEDRVDRAFVDRRASGYEAIARALRELDVDALARRAGVSRGEIEEVARGFAGARRASILGDLGIEQVPFSTLNAYLVRLLLALTGNLGRRGGNVYYQSFNPPDPRGLERAPTERSLVSGIPAIRALGSYAMFSPSLVPEEVMCDHPERLRALVVEGSNPLLSFSDTQRWREAIDRLDLLVVIDPAMTETARAADYVLPTPVGYEKWEMSGFPKGYPEIHAQIRPPVVAGPPEALPEAEIYARLSEAMGLFGEPPAPLRWLARRADRPRVRMALFVATSAAVARHRGGGSGMQARLIFWLYRLLGPHFPSPALTAVWLVCAKNAMSRRAAVLRTLGPSWRFRDPFAIAEELFRRVLAHPEGVEIARLDDRDNLADHVGFEDGRVRLAPEEMLREIERCVAAPERDRARYPLVLSAGVRTAWTANTIHRDPEWRKGRGPHCVVFLSPHDAAARGISDGDPVVLESARSRVSLPARVDDRMRAGHVAVPNGFGTTWVDDAGVRHVSGINLNELTASAERDPFTGCPHHKHVPCEVRPAEGAAG